LPKKPEASISDSLEVEKHLLPHMPYLLQDLWALGSSVDAIVEAVSALNLSSSETTILDLGCGKGALSIQLAAKCGVMCTGIDAMAAFLEDAKIKAEEYQVSHLCQFIEQDLLEYVSVEHDFDVVILASLGGVLGPLSDTIEKLRTQVRPGGYIIIDDGYLKKRQQLKRKGYEHYRNYHDTIQAFTTFNDVLIREVNTTEFSKKLNEEYLEAIEKRCAELIHQHPELEEDLATYLKRQEEECRIFDEELEGAVCLLQKI
jgi:2-polyprenyl-3-methyl-5-hydroxy-6-metoxy-1,4-benzoquinol methylase